MPKKLTTLRLDQDLHEWAKSYAKRKRTNLTAILVQHLAFLKAQEESEKEAVHMLLHESEGVYQLRRTENGVALDRINEGASATNEASAAV